MHSMYVIGAGRSPVAKLARQLQVQVSLCTGGPHRILSTYRFSSRWKKGYARTIRTF